MQTETNLGILLGSLHQGVQNPTLKNYRNTLETGLRILELASYDLPVLNDIFQYHHSFEDLCSKVSSYLVTNISLPTYRYEIRNNQLVETFDLDISKYDIRSLLILIRCHEISKGNTSRATRELFSNYTYIDENKKSKSLEEIKEALPNVSEKYLTDRYKDPQNINKGYLYAQMINANLYVLSYNHDLFTYSSSNGRVFNAFTSLNKIFRNNELAFGLTEVDVISANCQFVDKIFKFDRWKSVYSNLMNFYNISRSHAKIKYNATLNNHYLSVKDAEEVYLNAGYNAKESLILAEATANNGKGSFYRLMATSEGQIMDAFIEGNFKNDRQIRLHDAVYYDASFETLANAVELGIEFNSSVVEKEKLTLNLKVDSFKVVLSTPPTSEFVVKQYYEKSKVKQVLRTDNFTFYNNSFLQLSATFNISKPVISKDGIYSNPSESVWLERIQKLYKISTYLNNGNGDTDEHFKTCIEHLAKHIQFNKNYIYAVLPTWNFDINDALEYVKNRNWVYNGSVSLSLKDFNSLYHKERREFVNKTNRTKLKADLIRLTDCVENDRLYFIDKKKYHSAYTYEVGKLIDKVQDLIGVKKRDGIKLFNEMTALLRPLIEDKHMLSEKCVHNSSKPPISRRLRKKIDIFNKEKPKILSSLNIAIENIDDLQDITQLFTNQNQEEIMTHKYAPIKPATLNEAFGDPIDYTHSVYSNYTARTAMLQGKDFYVNYSRFCRMRELIRGKLWVNTNNYDGQKMAMDKLSIMLYNENYENVYAESMMSA
jgi:hypothetical protein